MLPLPLAMKGCVFIGPHIPSGAAMKEAVPRHVPIGPHNRLDYLLQGTWVPPVTPHAPSWNLYQPLYPWKFTH